MAKGSQFERDVCRALSEWWSNGTRDDVFWRSSQSGGRATSRAKKGKKTAGQAGDVAATDPDGFLFTRTFTVELKRGYNRADPMHLLDRTPKMAKQGFEAFLDQAIAARQRDGTPYWLIVHKRDGRVPMAYFPTEFFKAWYIGQDYNPRRQHVRFACDYLFYGMTFASFLREFPSTTFRQRMKDAGEERA